MRRLLGVLALMVVAGGCSHANASPPAHPAFSAISARAGTASATFTCAGPADCVVSAVIDSTSGAVLLTARTIAAGAAPVTVSMPCPAAGGPLVWTASVVGRTSGMADSPSDPLRTTGSCPLAVSPRAVMTASPISVGGP